MYPKHSVMKGLRYCNGNIKSLSFISDKYRLLHRFFDPSPDLSPSRPYQPEAEGQGLIRSEG